LISFPVFIYYVFFKFVLTPFFFFLLLVNHRSNSSLPPENIITCNDAPCTVSPFSSRAYPVTHHHHILSVLFATSLFPLCNLQSGTTRILTFSIVRSVNAYHVFDAHSACAKDNAPPPPTQLGYIVLHLRTLRCAANGRSGSPT
jgi:hypothetical protein